MRLPKLEVYKQILKPYKVGKNGQHLSPQCPKMVKRLPRNRSYNRTNYAINYHSEGQSQLGSIKRKSEGLDKSDNDALRLLPDTSGRTSRDCKSKQDPNSCARKGEELNAIIEERQSVQPKSASFELKKESIAHEATNRNSLASPA